MPRFQITLTRDITESATFEIEADSEAAACEAALETDPANLLGLLTMGTASKPHM